MKVYCLLVIQRKLDRFFVVAPNRDCGIPATYPNLSRVARKIERIGERAKMSGYEIVRTRLSESRLLVHRVAKLIKPKIGFPEIASDVHDNRANEERQETANRAPAAARYHCDCAPSISSSTI